MGNSPSKKVSPPAEQVNATVNSSSESETSDNEAGKKKIRFSLPHEEDQVSDEVNTKARASIFDMSSVLASDKNAELQLPDVVSGVSNHRNSISPRRFVEKRNATASPKSAEKRKSPSPSKAKHLEAKSAKQNNSPKKQISPNKSAQKRKSPSLSKAKHLEAKAAKQNNSPIKKQSSPIKKAPNKNQGKKSSPEKNTQVKTQSNKSSPAKKTPSKNQVLKATTPNKSVKKLPSQIKAKKSVGKLKEKFSNTKLKSTLVKLQRTQGLKAALQQCKPCIVLLDAKMVEQYLKKKKTDMAKTNTVKKADPLKVQKSSPMSKLLKEIDASVILSAKTKRSPSKAKVNCNQFYM